MYLAEISPDNLRSANVNKNAIFIVLGQLSAFVVNAILGNIWGDWGPIWRIMVLSAAIPSVILWIIHFESVEVRSGFCSKDDLIKLDNYFVG